MQIYKMSLAQINVGITILKATFKTEVQHTEYVVLTELTCS